MIRLARLAPQIILMLALAYITMIAFHVWSSFMDDAYTGFRYIDNLTSGYGLTFNPPERVEGITNIGWLLALTPLAVLVGETTAAKVLGLLFAYASVIVCYLIARWLFRGRSAWLFASLVALLAAVNFDFVFFAMSGMETAFLALLICLMVYFACLDRYWRVSAALGALAFLVHPEAGLIFPIFVFAQAVSSREKARTYLRPGLVFVGLVAVFSVARYLYFSDWLPLTFAAKPANGTAVVRGVYALTRGTNPNIAFPFNSLPALAFMIVGVGALWVRSPTGAGLLAGAVLAGMGFAAYAPPDWTGMGRYFAPYTPAALILLWSGLIAAHERLLASVVSPKLIGVLFSAYAVGITFAGIGDAQVHLAPDFTENYPGYVLFGKNLVEPSLWIRDHLPEDALIATRRIGAVGYYSRRPIFDYVFGLIDRDIAGLRQAGEQSLILPTRPALTDIWLRRMPDYVLEDAPIVEQMLAESGGSAERFEIHGVAYREIRRFKIGDTTDWVLCERIGVASVPFDAPGVILSAAIHSFEESVTERQ